MSEALAADGRPDEARAAAAEAVALYEAKGATALVARAAASVERASAAARLAGHGGG